VTVPPLESAPVAERAEGGESPPPDRSDVATDAGTASSGSGRTVGFVLGGAGIVGLGLGTVFFLQYNSKNGEAEDICPSGVGCMPGDQARHDTLVDDARSARTLFYVSAGAGAAALAAGIVLIATAPSDDAQTATTRFVAGPRADGGFEAGLSGVW
jgi:serine/threonine-protein kinase